MSWQEFLNNDRHEQEQLDICRALIEDATKDTTLWVQADPPEEERVHVLAIQTGLADLSRIIERRIERRKEARDDWDWSEAVLEVLSRLDKAREVRGHIVGKGLGRLAERLHRELPGPQPRRVSRATAPTPMASDPAAWRSRGDEYKQLADEETRIIRATTKERLLADCGFDSSPTLERARMFKLREGPDEHLKARFEALATKSGIALACPRASLPLEFWLCKLFLYLRETESRHLFAPTSHVRVGDNPQSDLLKPHAGGALSTVGGIITNVYEASASFCFWLEKQALEAEHLQQASAPQAPGKLQGGTVESKPAAERIGRNIDKLRKECGWSFDKLATKTGIDKKLILSHVNQGTKPHPNTMKEYAQAFAKELNRPITANNLEE